MGVVSGVRNGLEADVYVKINPRRLLIAKKDSTSRKFHAISIHSGGDLCLPRGQRRCRKRLRGEVVVKRLLHGVFLKVAWAFFTSIPAILSESLEIRTPCLEAAEFNSSKPLKVNTHVTFWKSSLPPFGVSLTPAFPVQAPPSWPPPEFQSTYSTPCASCSTSPS